MTILPAPPARRLAFAGLALVLMCGASTHALAQDVRDAEIAALRAQLAAMSARLDALEQAKAARPEDVNELTAATQANSAAIKKLTTPPAAAASLPNGKPALATADGRFTANIRAILMMDGGKYFQDANLPAAVTNRDLNEGVNFRRARIGFDGRLFKDFDYAIVYEFGGSGAEDPGRLYEASLTYTALKPFRIKVGAYEANIGLAAATSTSQMPLMERPSPAEVARGVAAGDSRVAFQVSANDTIGGDGDPIAVRWFGSTAVTGNTISTISSSGSGTAQPSDEQTAWIGRFAVAPFASTDWQAHLGLNAQYVLQPNDAGAAASARYAAQLRDRPELRLDGARLVDTGAIDADHVSVYGAEAAFAFRSVVLEGEAFRYQIDRRGAAATLGDPKFSGWYVQGSWVLTGERRPYGAAEARFEAPKQTSNFDPRTGAWGAFELAARYSVLDLNFREGARGAATPVGGVRGGEQKIMTLGVNWYLNPAIRVMLDWQRVDIDRLNAVGVQIGQEYDAVAARGQLTF